MIKSGLVRQNKFLPTDYPSDYNPQGRPGSYSISRPALFEQDIGFEKAKEVSPYQEQVEEYTKPTPKSVFRSRKGSGIVGGYIVKDLYLKNQQKYGQVAYTELFGRNDDQTTKYAAQRIVEPLIDASPNQNIPKYDITDDALAVTEVNPSTVLNLLDDNVEQETEAGSATVKIPSRSFSFSEEEFDPTLLMTDTYHNLQRQAKAMGYIPERPTKPEFLKSKRL